MTKEELNAQLNSQVTTVITGAVTAVKTYVDGKDVVLRQELTEEITKNLSGIDGLGEKLGKIEEMASAFAKFFDGDEDGVIKPEEILAKVALIQSNIDNVVASVTALDGKVDSLGVALNESIGALKDRVSGLEVAVGQNRDEIASVKSNLEGNYYNKVDVEGILSIKTDDVLKAVSDIFADGSVE